MKIKKAVIPVAGLGTRFFPATKAQAKEMLPIVDIPCVQYLVEECIKSGIKEIIFVINKDQTSVRDHFSPNPKLNARLKKSKKTKELKLLQTIEKSAKFTYVYQNEPKGDGHAILCAQSLVKNEPFAVLFGDDIWDAKVPPLKQLIKAYEKFNAPIVAVEKVPKQESNKYGIIDPTPSKEIKGFIEKPSPSRAPSNLAITGKYIVSPELLKTLNKSRSNTKDKEIRLIDGMINFIKKSPIYAHEIKGQRFDTGDKLGYLKAVFHFSLQNKEFGPSLKKYLKGLDLK
jgi:UTP--glucose-1-phosphate uridylyltransferase